MKSSINDHLYILYAGDSEKTQETARLPERSGPESAVRAYVLPRDGIPAPEDHTVLEFVRSSSVRTRSAAATAHR